MSEGTLVIGENDLPVVGQRFDIIQLMSTVIFDLLVVFRPDYQASNNMTH